MQLIAILLYTVSVLTLLSGITIFVGSKKDERTRSAWFMIATLFATCWTISISWFLIATPNRINDAVWHVNWTFISAIFIDIALLGYIVWKQKYGKFLTSAFLIAGIVLSAVFVINPELLYREITLSSTGNSLVTNIGPFYFIYVAFFCLLVPTVIGSLLYQIIKTRSERKHNGELVLLIGFAISGTMSLIFNLIMTFWRWDLVWIGPLAVSTTIIAFYYSVLRYRALNLSSIWLKVLSYVVIMASFAILYMVIFFIVFTAMFRGSPSVEVIALNFIMALVFLLLMPAFYEFNLFIRALISGNQTKEIKKSHDK